MTKKSNELKSISYEIFIGALSVLSILNIVLRYGAKNEDVENVLSFMNALLTAIFMVDFIMRLYTANNRRGYFFRQMGWADLIASLPFPQTKILRLFRLFRVYRLTKEFGARALLDVLIKDRAQSALLTLLLMGILVIEFGSMAMLRAESLAPDANITSASDAIWYTIVTISTVGYGDRYPTTNHGRAIGVLIIVIGVGIFGTFTGYLANLFLAPVEKKEEVDKDADPDDPQVKINKLLQTLEAQAQANAELQAQVEELAGML